MHVCVQRDVALPLPPACTQVAIAVGVYFVQEAVVLAAMVFFVLAFSTSWVRVRAPKCCVAEVRVLSPLQRRDKGVVISAFVRRAHQATNARG